MWFKAALNLQSLKDCILGLIYVALIVTVHFNSYIRINKCSLNIINNKYRIYIRLPTLNLFNQYHNKKKTSLLPHNLRLCLHNY